MLGALLVVVTYLLAGRLLLAHTGRNHEATPLQALLVGAGLWWLWSVPAHGLLGAALDSLWWLYLLAVVLLSLVLGKTHQNEGHSQTFWSRVFLVLLLASPWLLALVQHLPSELAELRFDAIWPALVVATKGLPPLAELTHFHLMQASVGSGFTWLAIPMAITQGQYTDGLLPIFNVILLGLLATEMVRWRGIHLDQDRVFAVIPAAGILAAVVVSAFGLGWVWSSLPYVMLAALVVAIARIVLEDEPPAGVQALHLAVLVLLLTQVTAFGPLLAAIAVVVYTLRVLPRHAPLSAVLGIGLVLLLPLLGLALWVASMLKAGYPAPGGLLLGLLQPQALFTWPLPEAVLTLVVVGALYGIFMLAERLSNGLGFHGLGLGASFVLLGLGMVAAHATRLQQDHLGVAGAHVLAVGDSLQHSHLQWGETVAVLDRGPYYSGLLRARLGHNNPVLNVGLPDTLAELQNRLRQLNVNYLWVHAPDDQVRGVLDAHLQGTASYLYQLGTEGLILKAVFPHPGYTSAHL